MQKILVIIAVSCFMFCSCVSRTNGGVSPDIINGATAVDTDLSGLQGQQAESSSDAQAITDTSEQIADTSQSIASLINTAIEQLKAGEIDSIKFADIVKHIQEREPIDYIYTGNNDIETSNKDIKAQESAE